MWYLNLMNNLVDKLPEHSKKEGVLFLKDLLKIFETKQKPELEFYLGIIEKSFFRFEHKKPGTVCLAEFSQYVCGLSLLYIKSTNEAVYRNKDFSDQFLLMPSMEHFTYKLGFYEFTRFLNQIEYSVFTNIKQNVSINFVNLTGVMSKYADSKTIKSFLNDCLITCPTLFVSSFESPEAECSEKFVRFIQNIEARYVQLHADEITSIPASLPKKINNKNSNYQHTLQKHFNEAQLINFYFGNLQISSAQIKSNSLQPLSFDKTKITPYYGFFAPKTSVELMDNIKNNESLLFTRNS